MPDDYNYIEIVFDGPPAHESGRFIEVEDSSGASVKVGEWIDRGDGYWALRITPQGVEHALYVPCATCKIPGAPAHHQMPRCHYRPAIRPHCTCSACF